MFHSEIQAALASLCDGRVKSSMISINDMTALDLPFILHRIGQREVTIVKTSRQIVDILVYVSATSPVAIDALVLYVVAGMTSLPDSSTLKRVTAVELSGISQEYYDDALSAIYRIVTFNVISPPYDSILDLES